MKREFHLVTLPQNPGGWAMVIVKLLELAGYGDGAPQMVWALLTIGRLSGET